MYYLKGKIYDIEQLESELLRLECKNISEVINSVKSGFCRFIEFEQDSHEDGYKPETYICKITPLEKGEIYEQSPFYKNDKPNQWQVLEIVKDCAVCELIKTSDWNRHALGKIVLFEAKTGFKYKDFHARFKERLRPLN